MAAVCPPCGESVVRMDDLTDCPECGTVVNNPKPGARRQTWIPEAVDLVAEAVAATLESKTQVRDRDDAWMQERQQEFLARLPHATLDLKLGNCRGFFNADWIVGNNPCRVRFHRSERTPYLFSAIG